MASVNPQAMKWQWENATAGAVAGFATVAALHPLDVVRTRFQVNDGRSCVVPLYRHTGHAVYTIARSEGLRGLYAGFYPAVLGSTLSWGLYFLFYNRAKERYLKGHDTKLGPVHHLVSAAEAGSLVCLCTNPIWLVKTRMQLQTSFRQGRPYSGFFDALRTILKEEGPLALYKGFGPGLLLESEMKDPAARMVAFSKGLIWSRETSSPMVQQKKMKSSGGSSSCWTATGSCNLGLSRGVVPAAAEEEDNSSLTNLKGFKRSTELELN